MSTELERLQEDPKLRVLDPDLPILASEVAIDIENILSDGPVALTAIHRLAEKLNNSIEAGIAGGAPRSLMDPATLSVLSEAMLQSGGRFASHSVADLLSEAFGIAGELSRDDPGSDRSSLEQARNFCVALSKAAMAYHRSIRDLSPSHPFRR